MENTTIQKPLISIIMPVFNVEAYLDDCILSVLNQTFINFELLLIDDGSTDSSLAICEKYVEKDTRVSLISLQHVGVSQARNVGLKKSRGKYISFIDSDDFVHPDFLKVLYSCLINNDSDISAVYRYRFDTEQIPFINQKNNSYECDCFFTFDDYWNAFSERANTSVLWNKLYKREIFNGFQFPVGKTHEDVWMIHHIYTRCSKMCVVKERLYYYRKHFGSIMYKDDGIDLIWVYNSLLIFYCNVYYKPSMVNYLIIESVKTSYLVKRYNKRASNSLKKDLSTQIKKQREIFLNLVGDKVLSRKVRLYVIIYLLFPTLCYKILTRKK